MVYLVHSAFEIPRVTYTHRKHLAICAVIHSRRKVLVPADRDSVLQEAFLGSAG